jgi:hypothetical protein
MQGPSHMSSEYDVSSYMYFWNIIIEDVRTEGHRRQKGKCRPGYILTFQAIFTRYSFFQCKLIVMNVEWLFSDQTQCTHPALPGGSILNADNIDVGRAKVEYSCKNNTEDIVNTLVGSHYRYCTKSAEWSGRLPACLGKHSG